MERTIRKCPNPSCGFDTTVRAMDTCPRCGGPLIEEPERPFVSQSATGAGRVLMVILAIAFVAAGGYLFYEKEGKEILSPEWREGSPLSSEKGTKVDNEAIDTEAGPNEGSWKGDPIKIGVVYGAIHEGDDEKEFLNAALMKADEINESGGIGGRPLVIDGISESIHRFGYVNTADYFASSKDVMAVVGYLSPKALMRDIDTYESQELPLISTVVLNSGFDRHRRWAFIAETPEGVEGRFLAKYIKYGLLAHTTAVLFAPGPYYERVEKEFVTTAKEIDLTVLGEIPLPSDTADFRAQLRRIREPSPDNTLIIGCVDSAPWILSQARGLGLTTRFVGDGSCLFLSDTAKNDAAAEGLMALSTLYSEEESPGDINGFRTAFRARYGTDGDVLAARFYDLVGLVAEAISVRGAERAAIRDYLASVDSFAEGYRGITGTFVFDEHGDLVLPFRAVEIRDGKFVPAKRQLFFGVPDVHDGGKEDANGKAAPVAP